MPIFLTALFVARGLPALVYRSLPTRTQTLAAALLQATSLSFLVVAGQIGVQLNLLRPVVYAALVAAGLLSVLLFPLTALTLLRRAEDEVLVTAVTRFGERVRNARRHGDRDLRAGLRSPGNPPREGALLSRNQRPRVGAFEAVRQPGCA